MQIKLIPKQGSRVASTLAALCDARLPVMSTRDFPKRASIAEKWRLQWIADRKLTRSATIPIVIGICCWRRCAVCTGFGSGALRTYRDTRYHIVTRMSRLIELNWYAFVYHSVQIVLHGEYRCLRMCPVPAHRTSLYAQ